MAEFTHSTTRTTDAQALWTHQYRGKSTIDALTALFSDESQRIETAAKDVRDGYLLDSAIGAQLDALGAIVGQAREGRSDSDYRTWIKARIRVNRSSGSAPDLYAVAKLILGSSASLWLRPQPVGIVLQSDTYSTVAPGSVLDLLYQTSSVSVPVQYWYPASKGDAFTYGSGSTPVAADPEGYDNGRFYGGVGDDTSTDLFAQERVDAIVEPVERWFPNDIVTDGSDVTGLSGLLSNLVDGTDAPTFTALDVRDLYPSITFGATDQRLVDTDPDQALLDVFDEAPAFAVAWVGSRARTGFDTTILRIEDAAGTQAVRVLVTSADEIAIAMEENVFTFSFWNGATVADTSDHVFVASFDGTNAASFWVDGTKSTDPASTRREPTGLAHVMLGNAASGEHWGKLRSEVLVFNRALTDDEGEALSKVLERQYLDRYF